MCVNVNVNVDVNVDVNVEGSDVRKDWVFTAPLLLLSATPTVLI